MKKQALRRDNVHVVHTTAISSQPQYCPVDRRRMIVDNAGFFCPDCGYRLLDQNKQEKDEQTVVITTVDGMQDLPTKRENIMKFRSKKKKKKEQDNHNSDLPDGIKIYREWEYNTA